MSHERHILIPDPPPNDNWETWYFFEGYLPSLLKLELDQHNITPKTHPRVLELFAGDAPISTFLSGHKWTDFTCVDWKKSKAENINPPKKWLYMNLAEVIKRLTFNYDVSEIKHLKGKFDIVTATFAIDLPQRIVISGNNCRLLCQYFCRENGFIYTV